MSVQFGRWSFDGRPAGREYFEEAGGLLAPYAPDGGNAYSSRGVEILYRAFHTTKESRREKQPHVSPSGAVITWDGRLDNREELIRELNSGLSMECTDVAMVAAAYEKWGADCFGKLIGDWALSVWNPSEQTLILAKDFVGIRHLYYAIEKDQVTWSTILDPLVLLAGKSFTLEEEYIAGWLSFFPATHLTPYVGIHAVPPSTFVRITPCGKTIRKYWDFDPGKRIRYRSDAEYEEHFRSVFQESVRRRLRSDTPVLAELSGGMDSSSIVCMADKIIAEGCAETQRLDTVSYYDDREPNWNERPYFSQVEEKRGRTGCHIDVATDGAFHFQPETGRFVAIPASVNRPSRAHKEFAACLAAGRNRVVLSGIGGDEVTGGVPTPIPELADLLAKARFLTLARQLKLWALDKKKPWVYLLFETVLPFLPRDLVRISADTEAPWLRDRFARRNRIALRGYETKLKLLGPLPSLQENISALNKLRRQLGCCALQCGPACEKRYPYLDRDLLEFAYVIPRAQMVRPRQRRSLMRRALTEIVPNGILARKRKAFVFRAHISSLPFEWISSAGVRQRMVSSSIEVVEQERFSDVLQKVRSGQNVKIVALMRTLALEFWLRAIAARRIPVEYSSCTGLSAKPVTELAD